MPTEEKPSAEAEGTAAPLSDDLNVRLDAMLNDRLNKAITGHLKRYETSFAKMLDERLAKLAPQPAQLQPEPGSAPPKADPALVKLQEAQERLTKQLEEERAARVAVERRARQDHTRQTVREALAKANMNPALIPALVSHFEATGALGVDDDGRPFVKVKRSRFKGSEAQEQAFEDLSEGIADWAKGDEAKAYVVTPPAALPQGGPRLGGSVVGARALPPLPEAKTQEEAARNTVEMLRRQGIDPRSLIGS